MGKTSESSGLADRQELFCQEYAKTLKGAKSAEAAGYSKQTANVQAALLLKTPKVKERIQEIVGQRLKKNMATIDFVISELFRVASLDISKAYDETGRMLPVSEMPEDVVRAITSVESTELFDFSGGEKTQIGETKKIRVADKLRALELLGKYHKLFIDRVEHSGGMTLEQIVAGSLDPKEKIPDESEA